MKFNPEKISLKNNLPPLRNDRFLDTLIKRIGNRVETYRPNPEDFIDNENPLYTEEQINNDLDFVQNQERKWLQQSEKMSPEDRTSYERTKKIADITESIMIDRLSGSWLNSDENENYDIIAHPTSTYDDYATGADVALEIKNNLSQQDRHVGLSIDITYSNKDNIIDKKLDRIFNEIYNGEQPRIKYFENSEETFKGAVDIARCVVVLSSDTVEDLFKKQFNKDRESLDNHPIQLSVLSQIEEQSETFYALSLQKGNKKMARIYEEVLNNIALLKVAKKEDYQKITSTEDTSYEDKYTGMKLLHKSLVRHLLPVDKKDNL